MAEKYYKDNIIAGGAVRDANGKRINTTYATKEELNNISVDGIKNKNNGETLHYWVGTQEEYNAQNIETEHPDWIATITDDTTSSSGGGISEEQVTEILAPVNEAIESKASLEDFYEAQVVIDSYVNGESGYRIWSDGYCEQWGVVAPSTSVIFLKRFVNTYYNLTSAMTNSTSTNTVIWSSICFNSKTENGFSLGASGVYQSWRACGYLAEGEY